MYEVKGQTISLIAGEVISVDKKFMPVYISADNTCKIVGASEKCVGYVQAAGELGEAVPVMINGVTMFKATAPVAAVTVAAVIFATAPNALLAILPNLLLRLFASLSAPELSISVSITSRAISKIFFISNIFLLILLGIKTKTIKFVLNLSK